MQRRIFVALGLALGLLTHAGVASAAGTLTPIGSPDGPIAIRDHQVALVIQNGFAHTQVTQTFFNPNASDLEAPTRFQTKIANVEQISASGGTNLYEGLELGLERLDPDRATNLILVTDAVTNTGIVDPKNFHELVKRHDVRFFGFLMGNSGNWPLMRTLTQATGGFADSVSNGDDLLGKVLLAKSKVT